jgi:hypothetical protein
VALNAADLEDALNGKILAELKAHTIPTTVVRSIQDGNLVTEQLTADSDPPIPYDLRPEALASALAKTIADAVVTHIKDRLEITIPRGAVITKVTGQAVGTPNFDELECNVQ